MLWALVEQQYPPLPSNLRSHALTCLRIAVTHVDLCLAVMEQPPPYEDEYGNTIIAYSLYQHILTLMGNTKARDTVAQPGRELLNWCALADSLISLRKECEALGDAIKTVAEAVSWRTSTFKMVSGASMDVVVGGGDNEEDNDDDADESGGRLHVAAETLVQIMQLLHVRVDLLERSYAKVLSDREEAKNQTSIHRRYCTTTVGVDQAATSRVGEGAAEIHQPAASGRAESRPAFTTHFLSYLDSFCPAVVALMDEAKVGAVLTVLSSAVMTAAELVTVVDWAAPYADSLVSSARLGRRAMLRFAQFVLAQTGSDLVLARQARAVAAAWRMLSPDDNIHACQPLVELMGRNSYSCVGHMSLRESNSYCPHSHLLRLDSFTHSSLGWTLWGHVCAVDLLDKVRKLCQFVRVEGSRGGGHESTAAGGEDLLSAAAAAKESIQALTILCTVPITAQIVARVVVKNALVDLVVISFCRLFVWLDQLPTDAAVSMAEDGRETTQPHCPLQEEKEGTTEYDPMKPMIDEDKDDDGAVSATTTRGDSGEYKQDDICALSTVHLASPTIPQQVQQLASQITKASSWSSLVTANLRHLSPMADSAVALLCDCLRSEDEGVRESTAQYADIITAGLTLAITITKQGKIERIVEKKVKTDEILDATAESHNDEYSESALSEMEIVLRDCMGRENRPVSALSDAPEGTPSASMDRTITYSTALQESKYAMDEYVKAATEHCLSSTATRGDCTQPVQALPRVVAGLWELALLESGFGIDIDLRSDGSDEEADYELIRQRGEHMERSVDMLQASVLLVRELLLECQPSSSSRPRTGWKEAKPDLYGGEVRDCAAVVENVKSSESKTGEVPHRSTTTVVPATQPEHVVCPPPPPPPKFLRPAAAATATTSPPVSGGVSSPFSPPNSKVLDCVRALGSLLEGMAACLSLLHKRLLHMRLQAPTHPIVSESLLEGILQAVVSARQIIDSGAGGRQASLVRQILHEAVSIFALYSPPSSWCELHAPKKSSTQVIFPSGGLITYLCSKAAELPMNLAPIASLLLHLLPSGHAAVRRRSPVASKQTSSQEVCDGEDEKKRAVRWDGPVEEDDDDDLEELDIDGGRARLLQRDATGCRLWEKFIWGSSHDRRQPMSVSIPLGDHLLADLTSGDCCTVGSVVWSCLLSSVEHLHKLGTRLASKSMAVGAESAQCLAQYLMKSLRRHVLCTLQHDMEEEEEREDQDGEEDEDDDQSEVVFDEAAEVVTGEVEGGGGGGGGGRPVRGKALRRLRTEHRASVARMLLSVASLCASDAGCLACVSEGLLHILFAALEAAEPQIIAATLQCTESVVRSLHRLSLRLQENQERSSSIADLQLDSILSHLDNAQASRGDDSHLSSLELLQLHYLRSRIDTIVTLTTKRLSELLPDALSRVAHSLDATYVWMQAAMLLPLLPWHHAAKFFQLVVAGVRIEVLSVKLWLVFEDAYQLLMEMTEVRKGVAAAAKSGEARDTAAHDMKSATVQDCDRVIHDAHSLMAMSLYAITCTTDVVLRACRKGLLQPQSLGKCLRYSDPKKTSLRIQRTYTTWAAQYMARMHSGNLRGRTKEGETSSSPRGSSARNQGNIDAGSRLHLLVAPSVAAEDAGVVGSGMINGETTVVSEGDCFEARHALITASLRVLVAGMSAGQRVVTGRSAVMIGDEGEQEGNDDDDESLASISLHSPFTAALVGTSDEESLTEQELFERTEASRFVVEPWYRLTTLEDRIGATVGPAASNVLQHVMTKSAIFGTGYFHQMATIEELKLKQSHAAVQSGANRFSQQRIGPIYERRAEMTRLWTLDEQIIRAGVANGSIKPTPKVIPAVNRSFFPPPPPPLHPSLHATAGAGAGAGAPPLAPTMTVGAASPAHLLHGLAGAPPPPPPPAFRAPPSASQSAGGISGHIGQPSSQQQLPPPPPPIPPQFRTRQDDNERVAADHHPSCTNHESQHRPVDHRQPQWRGERHAGEDGNSGAFPSAKGPPGHFSLDHHVQPPPGAPPLSFSQDQDGRAPWTGTAGSGDSSRGNAALHASSPRFRQQTSHLEQQGFNVNFPPMIRGGSEPSGGHNSREGTQDLHSKGGPAIGPFRGEEGGAHGDDRGGGRGMGRGDRGGYGGRGGRGRGFNADNSQGYESNSYFRGGRGGDGGGRSGSGLRDSFGTQGAGAYEGAVAGHFHPGAARGFDKYGSPSGGESNDVFVGRGRHRQEDTGLGGGGGGEAPSNEHQTKKSRFSPRT